MPIVLVMEHLKQKMCTQFDFFPAKISLPAKLVLCNTKGIIFNRSQYEERFSCNENTVT